MNPQVTVIAYPDLQWGFDGQPKWSTKPSNAYPRHHVVDPTPCYCHDPVVVAELAADIDKLFPVAQQPAWYVLGFEEPTRTNGYADENTYYVGSIYQMEPYIVLQGKRIPPHPAMTRYLVGHEYGHVVQYHLQRAANVEEKDFEREYAKIRGIDFCEDYGPQHWHRNTGEILANDFRILVCNLEREFWPHHVARPEDCDAIVEWWNTQQVKAIAATSTPAPQLV